MANKAYSFRQYIKVKPFTPHLKSPNVVLFLKNKMTTKKNKTILKSKLF